ncbi:sigma-70 family RNA polymerase sigma factor [Longispora albida]|uniref:sigma-70 family RNA polymerase sigma factor n=1 Tax=Longispora albida TaxID=203523 RepID=UPI000375C8DD|nr:sigma-70 family RNA polymerase sigma factor [Longispora albida]
MEKNDQLARQFEEHRPHLRAVAYRMLGSFAEAEDAVQEAWIKLSRADTSDVANLAGWLTTVVGRVCLDLLRSRKSRREDFFDTHVPDPVVTRETGPVTPEQEALLADSVGLALLVVLDTLSPSERLAFVLHDMFGVAFEEVAPIAGKSEAATRQLASRARKKVQGAAQPDPDLGKQRQVVEAFLSAARGGDFEALVRVLDPDVVLRADATALLRGAELVAGRALMFSKLADTAAPVLIGGLAGILASVDGRPFSLMAFTVRDGRIAEIHSITDPERITALTA